MLFNSEIFLMLTRLRLQRGEGKLLIASPGVRKRRKKAKKASSLPKGPIKATLEAQEELFS